MRGLGAGGGAFVVLAPNVQKELKLSDDQAAKVQDALSRIVEKYRDRMTEARTLPEAERPAKFRELAKAVAEDVKQSLAMTREQAERYDQIVLQQRGLRAFNDPAVEEKLRLTEDQKQGVRELEAQARQKFDQIRKDFQDDREGAFSRFQAARKEYLDKAVALLTDDQKKTWRALTGEPFEVQFPRRDP
jgi:hypothetical protein